LSLPDAPLPDTVREWMKIRGAPPKEAIEAIRYLMVNYGEGDLNGRGNLTEWYTCEVRCHFMKWVKKECDIPRVSDPMMWGGRKMGRSD